MRVREEAKTREEASKGEEAKVMANMAARRKFGSRVYAGNIPVLNLKRVEVMHI